MRFVCTKVERWNQGKEKGRTVTLNVIVPEGAEHVAATGSIHISAAGKKAAALTGFDVDGEYGLADLPELK